MSPEGIDYERLVVLAIVVFSVIAVVQVFSVLRALRKMAREGRRKAVRRRRPMHTEDAAWAVAIAVVQEVATSHPDEVRASRAAGRLTEDLAGALEDAREVYESRVIARHEPLFARAVDEVVIRGREGRTSG